MCYNVTGDEVEYFHLEVSEHVCFLNFILLFSVTRVYCRTNIFDIDLNFKSIEPFFVKHNRGNPKKHNAG